MRENPYVDLTPVFKDYEKHIGDLEKHNGTAPGEASSQSESDSQVNWVSCAVSSVLQEWQVYIMCVWGVCVCVCVGGWVCGCGCGCGCVCVCGWVYMLV